MSYFLAFSLKEVIFVEMMFFQISLLPFVLLFCYNGHWCASSVTFSSFPLLQRSLSSSLCYLFLLSFAATVTEQFSLLPFPLFPCCNGHWAVLSVTFSPFLLSTTVTDKITKHLPLFIKHHPLATQKRSTFSSAQSRLLYAYFVLSDKKSTISAFS